MQPSDIISMAQEAGMPPVEIISDKPVLYPVPDAIERFAALVAAAEREACAQVVEELGRGHGSAFAEFDCAAAIRARSKE